jgi:hypothetical protein
MVNKPTGEIAAMKILRSAAAMLMLATLAGCATTEIVVNPPANAPERTQARTIHGSFYGFRWAGPKAIVPGGKVRKVEVKDNALYTLVSMITVGLYVPMTVEITTIGTTTAVPGMPGAPSHVSEAALAAAKKKAAANKSKTGGKSGTATGATHSAATASGTTHSAAATGKTGTTSGKTTGTTSSRTAARNATAQ